MLECDRCGNEGTAYTVTFDAEGVKEFILCDRHNGPLEKLRDLTYGTWREPKATRKRGIQKVDLKDVTNNS